VGLQRSVQPTRTTRRRRRNCSPRPASRTASRPCSGR
jgi:hypothetical protein